MTHPPVRMVALAASIAVAFTISGCTSPPHDPDTLSTQVIHLVDVDGAELAAGASLGWSDDVFASPQASDPTFSHPFAVPAAANVVMTFISPRGEETDADAWNASGWLGLTPEGILLPNLKLSGNTEDGTGNPSGAAAVGAAGGEYSTGIAFLRDGKVIEADFVEITVTGNAEPANATWTWTASE